MCFFFFFLLLFLCKHYVLNENHRNQRHDYDKICCVLCENLIRMANINKTAKWITKLISKSSFGECFYENKWSCKFAWLMWTKLLHLYHNDKYIYFPKDLARSWTFISHRSLISTSTSHLTLHITTCLFLCELDLLTATWQGDPWFLCKWGGWGLGRDIKCV